MGTNSDASNGGPGPDGAIYAPASGSGNWTMPADKLRGGFRYLTIFLNSSVWVDLDGVSLYFTASPDMADLRVIQITFIQTTRCSIGFGMPARTR